MPVTCGQLEILAELNEISGPAGRVRIEPQAMAVLVLMAGEPGRVFSRESLLELAWPDRMVSDATLTGTVSRLRAALKEAGIANVCIETRSKRGYRLTINTASDERLDAGRLPRSALALFVGVCVALAWWLTFAGVDREQTADNDLKVEFTITLPTGQILEPLFVIKPGSGGTILVGDDEDSPLRVSVRTTPADNGMVRLDCEIGAISEWGRFKLTTAYDEINRFSMPAGSGHYDIAVRITPSAVPQKK